MDIASLTARYAATISTLALIFLSACSNGGDSDPQTGPGQAFAINNEAQPRAVTIGVSGTASQSATIVDNDQNVVDVTLAATWTSSDETVAQVISPGLIQGVSPGTATITVDFQSNIQTFDVVILATIPATIVWNTNSPWTVFKDGANGPWTFLERTGPSASFTVTDPNQLFAIAEFYTDPAGYRRVELAYLHLDDLANNSIDTNVHTIAKNVTLTFAGFNSGDEGYVTSFDHYTSQYYWSNLAQYNEVTPTSFYSDTSDLLASIFEQTAGNRISTHYYRENDLLIGDDFSRTVDINGPLSFAADAENTVTVTGLNGNESKVEIHADFETTNFSRLNIARWQALNGSQAIADPVVMPYRGLPAAQTFTGEHYLFKAVADYDQGVSVSSTIVDANTGDKNIPLPTPPAAADLTWDFLTTGAYVSSRFSWSPYQDATHGQADYYSLQVRHVTQDIIWYFKIDPNWLDAVNASFDTPDFTAIRDWDQDYALVQGFPIFARLQSYHSNKTPVELLRDGLMNGSRVNQLALSRTQHP